MSFPSRSARNRIVAEPDRQATTTPKAFIIRGPIPNLETLFRDVVQPPACGQAASIGLSAPFRAAASKSAMNFHGMMDRFRQVSMTLSVAA